MSRPTKQELRGFMRRCRENLVGLNKALTADNVRQIKIYLTDALGSLTEVADLAEERYDIEIECGQPNPIEENPVEQRSLEAGEDGYYEDDFEDFGEEDEYDQEEYD